MHRPVLRSILGRRRGPSRIAAAPQEIRLLCLRPFSATAPQSVLKKVPSKRERAAAAASDLGALSSSSTSSAPSNSSESSSSSPGQPSESAEKSASGGDNSNNKKNSFSIRRVEAKPAPLVRRVSLPRGGGAEADADGQQRRPAARKPIDTRALGAAGVAGGSGPVAASKIINVRSLPRRPSSFPGPSGVSSPSIGRFAALRPGRTGVFGGGAGAAAAAGRRGPGGGFGGAGGKRKGGVRRRRAPRKDRSGDGDASGGNKKDEFTSEEQAYMDALELGAETAYRPSLALEGLVGYGPAVATDSAMGRVGSALRGMRVLGGGAPFCDDVLSPGTLRERRARLQTVFFDNLAERAYLKKAEAGRLEPSPATKAAVLETTVQGAHEAPAFAASSDVLGTLRSFHARDYTYRAEDAKAFDDKVKALLPALRGGGAPRQAKQARV